MKIICCVLLLILPTVGFCISWQDLWFTPDQQAAQLLRQNEPEAAAETFSNPLWQGYAYYKSGQFQKALQDFSGINTPLANFNYGNTLVQLGQYQAAIAAYTHAIQQLPNFTDAIYNKSLLEKFLNQPSSNNQQLQAMNQWLQQIPDNPGGLLKQKFLRDHLRIEAEINR